jgi:hypothetical protein
MEMQSDALSMVAGNGRGKVRLLTRAHLDGRTYASKMFDKLASDIAADLGGSDELTAIEKALIEGFCGAAIVLQDLNARLALGEEVDLAHHAACCSSLVRIAAKIGVSRRSRLVSGIVEDHSREWSPMRASLARAAEIGRGEVDEADVIDAEEMAG